MSKEELLQTYFYIEDISGSENTLQIFKSSNNTTTITVYYTTTPDDSSSWLNIETSTTPTSITLLPNSKIYLKCTTNTWCYATGYVNKITCSNNYNVGGNIMSLLYGDEFNDKTSFKSNSYYHFYQLFQSSTTLVNAKDLQLPATILASQCYYNMFRGCTNLTTAPELPATTLASSCYNAMFQGCSSLTTAPALPATTLTSYCYQYMFNGCTSLTTAPELPATTLTTGCYQSMFYNCFKLNYIKANFINYNNDNNEFTSWVKGVSSTGTFVMNPNATYNTDEIRGTSGIPTNWTVVTNE